MEFDEDYEEPVIDEDDIGPDSDEEEPDDITPAAEDDLGISAESWKPMIILPPEQRQTPLIMSEYEYTEAIGTRAADIAKHGSTLVDVPDLTDAISIAKREMATRRNPNLFTRLIGQRMNGSVVEDVYEVVYAEELQVFVRDYERGTSRKAR